MNTTLPSIPTMRTGIDLQADQFVQHYAERITPIQFWVVDQYRASSFAKATELQKLATLGVVMHAVELCEFKNVFQHRRAILEALRLATGRLTDTESTAPKHEYRSVYANLVGKLATLYAATHIPDPSEDDACRCGQPECGAC